MTLKQVCFLFILHFVLDGPSIGANQDCNKERKKYYASTDKANYFQAFINCKNGGMELASVENEDQANALAEYLKPYQIEGYVNGFWLSGTNLNNVNSFQYYWLSTGKQAVYTNWQPGQPDNYQGKQHNIIWVLLGGRTGWDDNDANIQFRYVCETLI